MEQEHLVSIIMPTFNRQQYIDQAIESALKQTYENIELIIINDGSTDNTESIIKKYSSIDHRIKYIIQENMGPATARNYGLSVSSGKYVMFLDDDDVFMVYAVEKLLGKIKTQNENIKLVFGDIVVFSKELNLKFLVKNEISLNKSDLLKQSLQGNIITTPSQMIVEKKLFEKTGHFDRMFFEADDYEMFSRLILNCDIEKINVPVVYYRKHGNQITKKQNLLRNLSDKVSYKLFKEILDKKIPLFENVNDGSTEEADNWEELAKKLLNAKMPLYETAIEMLKLAQTIDYNEERQKLILSV